MTFSRALIQALCIQGHPAGAISLNHQQHEYEQSTCCDSSQWELVDTNVNAQL